MSDKQTTQEVIGVTKMSVNQIAGKRAMGVIAVILGKATGIKTGEDATGKVWEAITGTFQGHNTNTGEIFRSGKLFLPQGIHESIVSAVRSLPEGGSVKFAMKFTRVEADNPIGYSYQVVELLPKEIEQDELSDVMKAVAPKFAAALPVAEVPALPAPEATPAPAEAPKQQAPAGNKARKAS
jgi:hypothetical protein